MAQRILETMDLRSTVLTADALHCQTETARIIHARKGIYVLVAKENQRSLLEEIRARFSNTRSKIETYELGERTVAILDLPRNYAMADEWAGLRSYTI